tara:strand:+ start:123 stop:782 length:660 start_codon:yes stop_codon:yes gene_type:complete
MNYSELVTNLRNYTEVDENVFSESVIDTFITFAENKILREIDLDVFKQEASANMTAGNRFLPMPLDILTHRYIMFTDQNGQQTFLDFRDPSFMKEYWPNFNNTDAPKYYSIFDENTFYFAPTPDQSYVTQLGYIRRPTQLSSTNTTTWISTNAPEALFYAVLVQAHSYLKGPADMLQFFQQSYAQALQGLGVEQQGRGRRDEYKDGTLRIPLKSVSPGP